MQTFLPFQSFAKSAAALDSRRLNKQRVECKQIYNALTKPGAGWSKHPAVRMWEGHESALLQYALACCHEWNARGGNDFAGLAYEFSVALDSYGDVENPWWLGHPDFHASHRSNLLRKDPAHYGVFGWQEPPTLPYWWPTHHEQPITG